MFSSIWSFLRRNRRKFVISGILFGGMYALSKYSRYKLDEWRKREVQELLQRSRRHQHFESTERSCNQTIINLGATVKSSVLKILNSEAVISSLRSNTCDKISGWNKLKIYSVCKPATIIYANTMLVITLRIQLNLISAFMFKNLQQSESPGEFSEETQQKYLTLCGHFMDNGIQNLIEVIQQKVEGVVNSIALTDKMSLKDIEQLHWAVMSSMIADKDNDPAKNLSRYMLPPQNDLEMSDFLEKVVSITLDLLESEEVHSLMQSSISTGFHMLIDRVAEYFVPSPAATNGSTAVTNQNSITSKEICGEFTPIPDGFFDLHKVTIPMAKMIPILNGQVPDTLITNDMHSAWLEKLISDEKLKIFGANVYEAFSF